MALRNIPPIQCLVTFELLARLRSASRTAEELCVTVSAVSHRIRQLEAHLGFKLFASPGRPKMQSTPLGGSGPREAGELGGHVPAQTSRGDFTLTAEGTAYLANVREGLAAFGRMPPRSGAQAATRLSVAVTPTFARVYLMPRLETFRNAYPEVELTFQVSIPLLDVTAEEADLEVRFGPGHYADRESRVVTQDRVTPACSPSYLKEFGPFGGFDTLSELQQARLIRSPLEPWSSWFAACGLALPEPYVGAQFNDLGLVYDAAASGFGVALVREEMGAAWFDSGRLVRLSPRSAPAPNANHICWKPGALERWECAAFVDWMVG